MSNKKIDNSLTPAQEFLIASTVEKIERLERLVWCFREQKLHKLAEEAQDKLDKVKSEARFMYIALL